MSLRIVIDTNIVLDLLVFDEPAVTALRSSIDAGAVQWISCAAMRDELIRVLDYPQLAAQLGRHGRSRADVLAAHDARVGAVLPHPPRARCACTDPDDQVFIDLAVAHRARLLSKDRAVLSMRKRLAENGVQVGAHFEADRANDERQRI